MRPWSGYAPCERCGVFPGARHDYRCDCHAAERRIVCDRLPRPTVADVQYQQRAREEGWPHHDWTARDAVEHARCAVCDRLAPVEELADGCPACTA